MTEHWPQALEVVLLVLDELRLAALVIEGIIIPEDGVKVGNAIRVVVPPETPALDGYRALEGPLDPTYFGKVLDVLSEFETFGGVLVGMLDIGESEYKGRKSVGVLEGVADGVIDVVLEGVVDSILEGTTEGLLEGVVTGVLEGVLDGVLDDVLDDFMVGEALVVCVGVFGVKLLVVPSWPGAGARP